MIIIIIVIFMHISGLWMGRAVTQAMILILLLFSYT